MGTPNGNGAGTGAHDERSDPGSGKQFAKDVHSPGGSPDAPEGSGKQFAKDVHSPGESSPAPQGSGKQFKPSNEPGDRDDDPDDDDR